MAKLNVKINTTDSKNDTRRLLTFGAHGDLPSFLGEMGTVAYPNAVVQLANEDEVNASATITMNQSLQTSGDTIRIGNTTLTARNTTSTSPVAPDLASLEDFAILGRSGVTGSAAPGTVVTGDVGSSPTATITNFPPSTVVGGTLHLTNDAAVIQAQLDLIAAYTDLTARTPLTTQGVTDLGGATKTPGVYAYSSSVAITGTLTLDAQGDPNAVWIFQIGSTLTTASSSVVTIINGGIPGNVFWAVGSSATIGASSTFKGDILAAVSITLSGAPSTVSGRLLAGAGGSSGAVTIAVGGGTVTKNTGNAGGGAYTLAANEFYIGTTNATSAAYLAAGIEAISNRLFMATASGAIVTITAAFPGTTGNAVAIILTQTSAGMTASGIGLSGGVNDSAPFTDYRYF